MAKSVITPLFALLAASGQVLAANTQLQAAPDPLLVKPIRQALR
jgi:hypothetical protein